MYVNTEVESLIERALTDISKIGLLAGVEPSQITSIKGSWICARWRATIYVDIQLHNPS